MNKFNGRFCTNDFDQEMLDWIAANYPVSNDEWDVSQGYLVYGSIANEFWTYSKGWVALKPLTKNKFKEKIGMPYSKEFTKADLKDGMVVEVDTGRPNFPQKRAIFRGGIYTFGGLFRKDMEYITTVDSLFDKNGQVKKGIISFKYMGETIWQREPEQSAKEKRLEELYQKIYELKQQADGLRG